MTGILEGVLEGDVFLGELAVEVGSICMRGYRRRGSGKRCLLRWRSMIGVLEDSFRSLGRGARGSVNVKRFF